MHKKRLCLRCQIQVIWFTSNVCVRNGEKRKKESSFVLFSVHTGNSSTITVLTRSLFHHFRRPCRINLNSFIVDLYEKLIQITILDSSTRFNQ